MMRKLAFGAVAALVAVGQVGAAYADSTTGVDANRAALGLPVQARVGSCVAGAGCKNDSNLAGGAAIVPLILAAGVVAGGITLVATRHNDHDQHYAPVSP